MNIEMCTMNKPMKRRTLTALGFSLLFATAAVNADDLYRLSWRATVYTHDGNGQVIAHSLTEKDLIQKVATDNGLDPKSLAFVYRANKHDTAVVDAATGAFVADVYQMEYNFTEVSNST